MIKIKKRKEEKRKKREGMYQKFSEVLREDNHILFTLQLRHVAVQLCAPRSLLRVDAHGLYCVDAHGLFCVGAHGLLCVDAHGSFCVDARAFLCVVCLLVVTLC